MVYLDNAATTPVHPEVRDAMLPFLSDHYGNPSSVHQPGREARAALEQARREVAHWIGSKHSEVIFTSGGTEANQLALLGALMARNERSHFILSAIEHHSVLHAADWLRRLGAEVTVVPPDETGTVPLAHVIDAIQPHTACVSVMSVNNETGADQHVDVLATAVKNHRADIVIHSDMVQAAANMTIDLASTPVDLATFSAHKIYGPKGVGCLVVKDRTRWSPWLKGGAQERNRRAGTENVAGIVGFGAAAQRLFRDLPEHIQQLAGLRDRFVERMRAVDGMHINSPSNAVPGILNVRFDGVRSDTLLMRLDLEGIAASAGSACSAGSLEPSHVLLAAGQTLQQAREAIRVSFSTFLSHQEIDEAASVLLDIVRDLRMKKKR